MAAKDPTNYNDYIHEPNNQDLGNIPGDYGLPLIGHSISFLKDPFVWARAQNEKYGLLSRVNTFGSRGVIALGPDLAQQILVDSGRNFSSRMGFMDRVASFFPGSLIMEDFEHHKHQRRIFQSAFKFDALKHYTRGINNIYDRTLTSWEADVGSEIKFFGHIKDLLLEVAAEIFIGEKKDGGDFKKINRAFTNCVNGMMYIFPINLPGFIYYKGIKGRNFLQKYFGKLVAKKRNGDGLDMLSHLCREKDENGNFFTDEEVSNQMSFLLFAAHDTTTAAVTHTIYYLARNPEVKERLYQECKALGKDTLDYDDLNIMTYMQQVFNEVQRMRPSVPMVPRRTIREVEMAGHIIPAHTMVYNLPRFSHWMEEYWTEPTKFDPDRFSPERAEHKKHSFIFHPFGGGAHKCIGMHFSQMEYKCFMYKFMLKFDFESRHKKEPYMQSLPLPKPADNMPIMLIKR
ncbi:MAG: cytochrome P450 [Moraxellaceae bacterium]|nr:MAG: cytochrome P450 [Moraxellaceae bacterium]